MIDVLIALCGVPVLVAAGYLGLLTIAGCGRRARAGARVLPVRFDVVIPAHNEEQNIADAVTSVVTVDYPRSLFRVVVVADNCSDRTAERAAAAGAQVLQRSDLERRGKGHALALAFDRSLTDGLADAVVVVDADTVVSRNLLTAFAGSVSRGGRAAQAEYVVRNPDTSWRTRLMTIAFSAFHHVRSAGRARLRLSCGLRGNGMMFTTETLRQVPYNAFSIVEDVEYGITLGLAGIRVDYVDEARVLGMMVATGQASRTQRQRWEDGRRALRRAAALRLLRESLLRQDVALLDLAVDLIVPPLSQLATVVAAGTLAAVLFGNAGPDIRWPLLIWSTAASALAAHVVAGWVHSGIGLRGLVDLARAPAYIAWKLALRVRNSGRRESETWIRTSRETIPKEF